VAWAPAPPGVPENPTPRTQRGWASRAAAAASMSPPAIVRNFTSGRNTEGTGVAPAKQLDARVTVVDVHHVTRHQRSTLKREFVGAQTSLVVTATFDEVKITLDKRRLASLRRSSRLMLLSMFTLLAPSVDSHAAVDRDHLSGGDARFVRREIQR
jgi:hypothetical protein